MHFPRATIEFIMNSRTQGRLYFDITDIVDYAHGHSRVSGIQRVVVNVIRGIASRYGNDRVRCLYFHRGLKTILECDPTIFVGNGEFDAELMLYKLGLLRNWKIFPSRTQIKAHLLPLRKQQRELLRAFRKFEIYAVSLIWPRRLKKLDLQRMCDRFRGEDRILVTPSAALNRTDSLIMLGANWECEAIVALAGQHRKSGGDVVQMIYDLIPFLFKEYFSPKHANTFNKWLREVTPVCSRFLCISECTARDLRAYLEKESISAKVSTIALAHEFMAAARGARALDAPLRLQQLANREFVLCVGTIEVRKNGAALLRAWRMLAATHSERMPLLVFAGRRGWLTDAFDAELAADTALAESVRVVESPSDQELAYLYANCLFTSFPSLYEGWGLPVGESAWFGKYCIASNASSIPEVCGNLIDYVAPDDLAEFVTALRRAILEKGYVEQRERAIVAARLRTWSDVARDIGAFVLASDK
jgi:glycosyltransferase involved in cell wall biosynthesis